MKLEVGVQKLVGSDKNWIKFPLMPTDEPKKPFPIAQ